MRGYFWTFQNKSLFTIDIENKVKLNRWKKMVKAVYQTLNNALVECNVLSLSRDKHFKFY